jgi:hypothetical protein
VECVLVATIDRLCFHLAKIEMIKWWRGRGGRCRDMSVGGPLYPQERTCAVQIGMSALGQ